MGVITFQDNSNIPYDVWQSNRVKTLGSSEVGAACIGSPYKSALEIFYEKVTGKTNTKENLIMFLGKEIEPLSQKMWSYYDDDGLSILKNIEKGIPIKKGGDKQKVADAHLEYIRRVGGDFEYVKSSDYWER